MSYAAPLSVIMLTVLLGAMSPGPSFLMVAGVSVSRSRQQGIAAALGMGAGGLVLCLLAMLGIRSLFAASPRLYMLLQICGGAFLVYFGVRIWRKASEPLSCACADGSPMGHSVFRTAFVVQICNPQTIIFFASVFASVLPEHAPAWVFVLLLPLVFAVESAWYGLVAVLLSARRLRDAYLRARVWVDRAAGALIVLLGVKLFMAAF